MKDEAGKLRGGMVHPSAFILHPLARRAFTVVELIVVIGIIAALAAMLMPALRAARRQATIVVCASNLRQINTAALLHAQDHRGFLPLAGEIVARQDYSAGANRFAKALRDPNRNRYTYALANTWGGGYYVPVPMPGALAPYMGVKDLPYHDWHEFDQVLNRIEFTKRFSCPATDARTNKHDTGADLTLTGQGTMMSITTSIGSGYTVVWSSNSDFAFNEGVFGFHESPSMSTRRLGGNLNRMKNLDRLLLFSDAKNRSKPAYPGFKDPWICWTPNPYLTGPVTLADAFDNNGKAIDKAMFDLHRHQRRMNVAFADGHVQLLQINSADLKNAYLLTK